MAKRRTKKRQRPSSAAAACSLANFLLLGIVVSLCTSFLSVLVIVKTQLPAPPAVAQPIDAHGDHAAPAVVDNAPLQKQQQQPVPLVIGGTDGSGTRGFAMLVEQLGVPFLADNRVQMDVHAWKMSDGAGWPGVVLPIVNQTHSIVYDMSDRSTHVTQTVRKYVLDELRTYMNELDRRAQPLLQKKRHASSSRVSFGFKAPITMMLVPALRQVFSAFKFVHVVRDGRDMAFSGNQSPVKKFYDVYYGNSDTNAARLAAWRNKFGDDADKIKAMQLWNEWNFDVHRYLQQQTQLGHIDYLVLRTEDLVFHRYETIIKLADFVGSTLSDEQLCKLARETPKPSVSAKAKPQRLKQPPSKTQSVTEPYGKWEKLLKDNDALRAELEAVGSQGLAAFGYEPKRALLDALPSDERCQHVESPASEGANTQRTDGKNWRARLRQDAVDAVSAAKNRRLKTG